MRPDMTGSEKKKEERLRGGHVTGSFARGSREGLQRAQQTHSVTNNPNNSYDTWDLV